MDKTQDQHVATEAAPGVYDIVEAYYGKDARCDAERDGREYLRELTARMSYDRDEWLEYCSRVGGP